MSEEQTTNWSAPFQCSLSSVHLLMNCVILSGIHSLPEKCRCSPSPTPRKASSSEHWKRSTTSSWDGGSGLSPTRAARSSSLCHQRAISRTIFGRTILLLSSVFESFIFSDPEILYQIQQRNSLVAPRYVKDVRCLIFSPASCHVGSITPPGLNGQHIPHAQTGEKSSGGEHIEQKPPYRAFR